MGGYRPSENVVFTSLFDGTGVLLDLRTKLYYTLNETGRLIWEQLERGLGPEEIARRLSEEYDVSPEEALREVEEFLGKLREEGLVEVEG